MGNEFNPSILLERDYDELVGQGDCNCDCACSFVTPNFKIEHEIKERYLDSFQIYLKTPEEIFISRLEENWYAVSNPLSLHGRVVVVDRMALQIIKHFRNKRPISSALKSDFGKKNNSETVLSIIQKLHKLHILVDDNWKPYDADHNSDTLTAWLHVTNDCNLRCNYCYLKKTPQYMAEDIGKKAIDSLFRTANIHSLEKIKLKFSGGEASLNFKVVILLFDYAKKLAFENDIYLDAVLLSNGVGISERMINDLIERKIRLMISLDGIGNYNDSQRKFLNGKGSFNLVVKTLERLLSANLIPEISVTITSQNAEGLPELIDYILSLNRNFPFSLNFYRENENSQSYEELRFDEDRIIHFLGLTYDVIENYLPDRSLLGSIADRANFFFPHSKTCGVGENYVVIDEKGRVSKCQMKINDTVGTINLDEIDLITLVQQASSGIKNLRVQEKEGCADCQWRNWCSGGCPAYTYQITQRYDIKSPNCRIYKAIYPRVLKLEGLRIINSQKGINSANLIPD